MSLKNILKSNSNLTDLECNEVNATLINSNKIVVSEIDVDKIVYNELNTKYYNAKALTKSLLINNETVITGYDNVASAGGLTGFDLSTGVFTAPEEGIYSFHIEVHVLSATLGNWDIILEETNGSRFLTNNQAMNNLDSVYIGGAYSGGVVTKLASGQTVRLKVKANTAITTSNYFFFITKII